MSHEMLLPNRFKRIGWFILVPATLAGILLIFKEFEAEWFQASVPAIFADEFPGGSKSFTMIVTDLTNTVVGVLFLVGAMMVAFAREKVEDEYIRQIRLSSLMWAVWVNYLLLLVGFLFIYGIAFLYVMIYNMFTILIIFITRYHYLLYRTTNATRHEK
ncbi:MAG: hypothetical protein MUE58_06015 [Chitinophagaceae bacterium]|nr:hypothetical protein [Chitinophagaceae bacterium]